MSENAYHITFAQNGEPAKESTAPWKTVGTNEDVQLYGYDAKEYYICHLENMIENRVVGCYPSIKYLGKHNESINLGRFFTGKIVLELEQQLNNFYRLVHVIVANDTSTLRDEHPDFLERFIPSEINENKYTFDVNKILRIGSVATAFIIGLEHRYNVLDGTVSREVNYNPLNTEIIKLRIEGRSISTSIFNISTKGYMLHREFRKRIYIFDSEPVSEIGYLVYNTIDEKYTYKQGNEVRTVYKFNIIDSVLYNVSITGNDLNNNVIVDRLIIVRGTLVLDIDNDNTMNYRIRFGLVELDNESTKSTPNSLNMLSITQSLPPKSS